MRLQQKQIRFILTLPVASAVPYHLSYHVSLRFIACILVFIRILCDFVKTTINMYMYIVGTLNWTPVN